MARRKLSTQGRIVAAGISIGIAGALAGFMAAGDHTADASPPVISNSSGRAVPSDDGTGGARATTNLVPQYSPRPQTRTGGS